MLSKKVSLASQFALFPLTVEQFEDCCNLLLSLSTFEVRQMICARLEFVYQMRKLAVISALSQMKGTCYLVSLHS